MAGVLNKTERQFNIRGMQEKTNRKVTIRLAPGFNAVNDDHWQMILKSKNVEYVNRLKQEGKIDFGELTDQMELDRKPDVVSKSKAEKVVSKKPKKEK